MTLQCAAPFCSVVFDAGDDCLQLDIPDNTPLFFCSLKHLAVWAEYHKQRGFRGISTVWIEPKERTL